MHLSPRLAPLLVCLTLPLACGSGDDAPTGDGFPDHPPAGVREPTVTTKGTTTLVAGQSVVDEALWSRVQVDSLGTLRGSSGDAEVAAALVVGRVLVVPGAGGTNLRRVTSVATEGADLVAQTTDAPLNALVADADWTISVGDQAAKADLVQPWIDVDLAGKQLAGDEDGPLSLKISKGRFAGNPRFDLNVVVSHSALHLFSISSTGFFLLEADFELEGTLAKSLEHEVTLPLYSQDIVALVGGVPVWVRPFVELKLKGEVGLSVGGKATAGFRATLPATWLQSWELAQSPHWSKTTTGKVTFKKRPVKIAELSGTATGKLTLTASIGVKLYQKASTSLDLSAWSELTAKAGDTCTWSLKAGANADVKAAIEGFGPIDDHEVEHGLYSKETELGSGTCPVTLDAGGAGDVGAVDSGGVPLDAGVDTGGAGISDTGTIDTGTIDTGTTDSGTSDTGTGVSDSGTLDDGGPLEDTDQGPETSTSDTAKPDTGGVIPGVVPSAPGCLNTPYYTSQFEIHDDKTGQTTPAPPGACIDSVNAGTAYYGVSWCGTSGDVCTCSDDAHPFPFYGMSQLDTKTCPELCKTTLRGTFKGCDDSAQRTKDLNKAADGYMVEMTGLCACTGDFILAPGAGCKVATPQSEDIKTCVAAGLVTKAQQLYTLKGESVCYQRKHYDSSQAVAAYCKQDPKPFSEDGYCRDKDDTTFDACSDSGACVPSKAGPCAHIKVKSPDDPTCNKNTVNKTRCAKVGTHTTNGFGSFTMTAYIKCTSSGGSTPTYSTEIVGARPCPLSTW